MISHRLFRCSSTSVGFFGLLLAATSTSFADVDPQVEKALSVKPRQRNVNVEIVPAAELEKCTKRAEKRGDIDGLFIIGSKSQPLRWFGDTNKDRPLTFGLITKMA